MIINWISSFEDQEYDSFIISLVPEKCFEIDRISQEMRQMKKDVSIMEQKARETEQRSRDLQQQVRATKQQILDKEYELRDIIQDLNASGGVFGKIKKWFQHFFFAPKWFTISLNNKNNNLVSGLTIKLFWIGNNFFL